MKKRLLSFFALALMVLAVSAQSWTAPSIKLVTDQVPEKAYIYNVEQKMFLTKGGAWGNHASIKPEVAVAFLYEMQAQQDGGYKLHCSAGANNGLLGRQSIEDVYTDWKAQADWGLIWDFVAVDGGYHIRTAANDPHYGDEVNTNNDTDYNTYLLGYNPERDDLNQGSGDPMGTHEGVYMVDPANMEGYSVLWAFMTEENYAVYNAQVALYDKLNKAVEIGYSEAELAHYASQLTSSDTEAIAAATAAVDELIINYAYNHASPENPYDVTGKIQNPTFEGARGAEPAGWIDEFGNMLIQNNKDYHIWDDEAGVESSEFGFQNFSQNWTSSGSITDSNIYQVVSNLPQGTYILQADAIATGVNAETPVSGAQLYAESGAARYGVDIDKNGWDAPGGALPHRYQLMVTHMGGDLKIGYGFTPGSVKWFGIDNVKLFYAGPVDNPGLVALASALSAAEPYLDYYAEDAAHYYSEATKTALEAAVKAGEAAQGGSSEACLEAAGAINDVLSTAKAEVTAYGKLEKFVEKVMADVAKYPFIEELGDKYDEYKASYEDKLASIDEINGWIESYDAYIVEGIKAALPKATAENPIEVTGLYANLGFEENQTESKTPNNWNCEAAAFKARVHTAEVWQEKFDAYTVLNDLPAGAYRITAHALARCGSSVDSYNSLMANGVSPVTSEFYANNSAVKVADQSLGASAEKLYTNDVDLTGLPAEEEHEALWAPNSMEGARVYFDVENTPYVNVLTTNLLNDGDPLRIGFRENGVDGEVVGNSWTIWSDVRVYYIGVSSDALYEEMKNVAARVATILNASDVDMVKASSDKLTAAYTASENAAETDSEEKIKGIIDQLNEAMEYYTKGISMVHQIMDLVESYEEVLNTYDADGTAFAAMMEEAENAVTAEEFESVEQIENWLEKLPQLRAGHIYTAIVVNEGLTPSDAEPVDITPVLVNASFDEGQNTQSGATGWTFDWTNGDGGHIGWNNTTQQEGSHNAFEYWKVKAFDMHQTVVGLPAGYYRISCQGLYRPGNNTPEAAAIYAENPDNARDMAFYVNEKSVPMASVYDYAQAEATGADGEATVELNGATVYMPNTMISAGAYFEMGYYTNTIIVKINEGEAITLGLKLVGNVVDANWCVYDNFKIEALGPNSADAIDKVGMAVANAQIFNLNGQLQNRLQKGVNIVRKANGEAVKVLVK